jgi:type IV pilus assembly protein PilB
VGPTRKKRLGEILRERGKISAAHLAQAVENQKGKPVQLGEILYERGHVEKKDLVQALEESIRTAYVDCTDITPNPEMVKLLPRVLSERYCALPLEKEGRRLVVVMAQPQDLTVIEQLRFSTGKEISPRLGFRIEIIGAIGRAYTLQEETLSEVDDLDAVIGTPAPNEGDEMEFVTTSSRQNNREAFQEAQAELMLRKTPAVRLVSEIIISAMEKQASDIHIEPQVDEVSIRIRVDGVLRDLRRIPLALQNSLLSRIKILSDMDISDRRSPQDGRFLVKMQGRSLDMRISTLPTQYGEKIVMRLLEPGGAMRTLSEMGLASEVERKFLRLLSFPQGTILVTGPTGSGKSTTLYASLNILRNSKVNIITVEDPIEYVLPGISQVHVNTKAGLTFASSLRSILRQDPNIIMVGEIRDKETAEICMKAAQTGHLVLSTLHTNDSVSAISRLLDIGIPAFLIASSVTGILGQRLARRLCACSTRAPATEEYVAQFLSAGGTTAPEWHNVAVGCDACDQTGFKGRVGIYELLVMDESVRSLIRSEASSSAIRDWVHSQGMNLMQEDALDKVAQGLTTLEEVLRVIPFEEKLSFQCESCSGQLTPAFRFCPYCGVKRDGDAMLGAPQIKSAQELVSHSSLEHRKTTATRQRHHS